MASYLIRRVTLAVIVLFGLLVAVERQSLVKALLFSLAVPIGTDFLFGILLKSPLPRGIFGI